MATNAAQATPPLQFFQIACGDLKELEGVENSQS